MFGSLWLLYLWMSEPIRPAAWAIAPCPTSSPSFSPTATRTTVALRASPTPSPSRTATRPLPINVTPASGTPSQIAPIFQIATQQAINYQTPGFNSSTAVAATAQAFLIPSEEVFISTPVVTDYIVTAVQGMNVRESPSTQARVVGAVRYGDRVTVFEHQRGGAYVWGRIILNWMPGWVALVYDPNPSQAGEEIANLKAVP